VRTRVIGHVSPVLHRVSAAHDAPPRAARAVHGRGARRVGRPMPGVA